MASTDLDDPAASFGTTPVGINNSGTVVGYFLDAGFTREGFIKSGNNYTTLDDPLATNRSAFTGINASGLAVGFYGDASGSHGFIYNPSGSGTFTTLNDPAATFGTFPQARYRQQCDHFGREPGSGRTRLASRRWRNRSPDRIGGQLKCGRPTRASHGGI
jgi:hypothetical protein